MQGDNSTIRQILQLVEFKQCTSVQNALAEKILGQDVLTFLTRFLTPQEMAKMCRVSKGWLGSIHLVRNYVRNKICVILDNTVSMTAESQQTQREFLTRFAKQLDPNACLSIRLVCPKDIKASSLLQEVDVCAQRLLELIPSLLTPEFYNGHSTPLFQSICNAVTEGFHILLCLTDGEENMASGFDDIHLFNSDLEKLMQENGATTCTWRKKSPLTSFMKALLQVVPSNRVFLPTIVGLNMNPEDALGLLPVYTITSNEPLEPKVAQISRATVSREAGGGRQSLPAVVLQDRRYLRMNCKARRFFRNSWRMFPEAKNMHCFSLLISYRKAQQQMTEAPIPCQTTPDLIPDQLISQPILYRTTVAPISQALSWDLPSPEQRKKQGWYFKYAKQVQNLAIQELEMTRDAALTAFNSLSESQMKVLLQESVDYNFERYRVGRKQKKRKRRSEKKSKVSKKVRQKGDKDTKGNKATPQKENKKGKRKSYKNQLVPPKEESKDRELNRDDFVQILGPATSESVALAKLVPRSCYPVSVPTFFWLIRKDSRGQITHDALLNTLKREQVHSAPKESTDQAS